jgi:hypothetical protein
MGEGIVIWKHDEWTIKNLLRLCNSGKMDLSPDYQRNPIWTAKAQRLLIDTILRPEPIPNFFVRRLGNAKYEMVDGQQRARSILAFYRGQISTSDGKKFEELGSEPEFLNYPLNVTLITRLAKGEEIERFYALVNSSGLRLNTPELRKAKYYDTTFLALCNELANSESFSSLGLFGSGTVTRMNDVELVSELVALLKFGVSEKKVRVEQLYEEDISNSEKRALYTSFQRVTNMLQVMDAAHPLKKTRFKQRADLYTLFAFISLHIDLDGNAFRQYYRVLLEVAPGIRPTQEDCIPLRDYARNCVSQSNSENARQDRLRFLEQLLRNSESEPNETQKAVAEFLDVKADLIEIGGAWALSVS